MSSLRCFRLFVIGLGLCALLGGDLSYAQGRKGFSGSSRKAADAERRRVAFEEAMRKIEEAEARMAAENAKQAEREAAAKQAQEQMRESVEKAGADVAAGSTRAADLKRAEAQGFATAVQTKVPEDVRSRFTPPPAAPEAAPAAPAKPAPKAEPKPTPPAGGATSAPEKTKPAASAAKAGKGAKETVIEADGRVIFDGSGRFGKEHQVVIFEDNVVVTNPEFVMKSDRLIAYFKRGAEEGAEPEGAEGAEPAKEEGGNQLERAVATGREVVVRKLIADGEPQIAKARKATFFADRQEVMLEIWPQVQRGKNLVIAKSKDTVIILKGEEMVVNGPVRTTIVGKDPTSKDGGAASTRNPKSTKNTVIDAERGAVFNRPSQRSGQREVFFEGDVSVSDPGFGMFGDDLTAYFQQNAKTGETTMSSAVMRGNKVEVQQRTSSGERMGRARRVVFIPASGDIRLEQDPELYRGGEWFRGGEVAYLNKDSKNFSHKGGRAKMSFAPGASEPE